MIESARNLLNENDGNFGRAVNELLLAFQNPAGPAFLRRDTNGIIADTDELKALGYEGLHFGLIVDDDIKGLTKAQQFSLGAGCGFDFRVNSWAPAFGQFAAGDVFGTYQVNRFTEAADTYFGGVRPVDAGPYPWRVIWVRNPHPDQPWTYAAFIAWLKAHPIDLHTREGGPVATGG